MPQKVCHRSTLFPQFTIYFLSGEAVALWEVKKNGIMMWKMRCSIGPPKVVVVVLMTGKWRMTALIYRIVQWPWSITLTEVFRPKTRYLVEALLAVIRASSLLGMTWQALHTWIWGFSAILPCRSSQALSGWMGTLGGQPYFLNTAYINTYLMIICLMLKECYIFWTGRAEVLLRSPVLQPLRAKIKSLFALANATTNK